jgi:hypothetical protein
MRNAEGWSRQAPLSGSEDPSHRTPAKLRPWVERSFCGSGLGRDRADACRTAFDPGRCRGQRPLPQNPSQAPAVGRAQLLWERPWPRQGRCRLHSLRYWPVSGSEDPSYRSARRRMTKKNRGSRPRSSLLQLALTPSPASPVHRRKSTAGSACRPSSDARRST